MSLPHNLTSEQIAQVQALVDQGDYAGAWTQLAQWGDSYARRALHSIHRNVGHTCNEFNTRKRNEIRRCIL